MTLLAEKGTFTKTTSTSTPVSQQVNLVDSSLTPKLLILWTNGQTTTDGTFAEGLRWSYGFSDGTNDFCQQMTALDNNTAQTETYTYNNNCIISIVNQDTQTEISRADVTSFGAGQFTLNWSVQSDTNAIVIHYIVVGGTDITNVNAFDVAIGDTSTGNHSYNGTGATFTPDFAFVITSNRTVTTNTLSSGADDGQFAIGWYCHTPGGPTRFAFAGRTETIGTSDTDMCNNISGCAIGLDEAAGTINFNANPVSLDNAAGGGITVNITTAAESANHRLAFLMVKGGSWGAGSLTQRNGAGTQTVTLVNTSLTPKLVFLGGVNAATTGQVVNNYLGIGASDGTREGCSWCGDQDASGSMINTRSNLTTKIYRQATPHPTASSSNVSVECDLTDISTAGQFTLDWTTGDAVARRVGYWTVGAAAAAGNAVERALATETVTTSDTISRLAAKTRARSETVTVSESIARLSTKSRAQATQTVTIAETIARTRGSVRAPAGQTVTISETLGRVVSKTRGITEGTTTTDTLARLAAKSRPLATQTVTTSDSVDRVKTQGVQNIQRTITEPTINVGETINRLKASNRVLNESITVTETTPGARLKGILKTLAESVTTSSTVARLKGSQKILTETITTGDTINRLTQKFRALATQTITVSETIDRVVTDVGNQITKSLSESVTISETALTTLRGRVRVLTETVTTGDVANRLTAKLRALAVESITVTDQVTQFAGLVGREIIIVTDQVTRVVGHQIVKSLTESVTVTEASLNKQTGKTRSLPTQTVTIGDIANRLKSSLRTLSESITTTDTIARARGVLKTLAESVTTGGTPNKLKGSIRTLSESISTSGTANKLTGKSRALATEVITIAGTVERLVGDIGNQITRSLSESITVSETALNKQLAKTRSLSQNVGASDILNRTKSALKAASASVTITEISTTRLKNTLRILAESITTSGTPNRQKASTKTLSESITVTGTASRLAAKTRALAVQIVTVSETVNRVVTSGANQVSRSLTQFVTITETSLTRRKGAMRQLVENINISDILARLGAKSRSIPVQIVTITSSVVRVRGKSRELAESITTVDGLTRLAAKVRDITQVVTIVSALQGFLNGLPFGVPVYTPGQIPYRRTKKTKGPFYRIRAFRETRNRARQQRQKIRKAREDAKDKARLNRQKARTHPDDR